MKNLRVIFFLLFLFISLVGCQQSEGVKGENPQSITENLETIIVYPRTSHSETIIIEDEHTIKMIYAAVSDAVKQPGIVNIVDPHFIVVIGDDSYFLWIDKHFGAIMHTEETHIVYSLSEDSVKKINELFH